ncbi:hypothetical protein [Asticcacaulis sp.]|uniref:spike base protein, RCAP_Rcc01079 family n=1 Tax=Asticcacaulis sp. TaxID=1872648 RepID=UPI0031D9A2F4
MADKFESYTPGLDAPFSGGHAVIGGADFAQTSRALYVGGAGNLTVVTREGQELTFANFSGWLPGRVTQVKAAGLTASNIVAVW